MIARQSSNNTNNMIGGAHRKRSPNPLSNGSHDSSETEPLVGTTTTTTSSSNNTLTTGSCTTTSPNAAGGGNSPMAHIAVSSITSSPGHSFRSNNINNNSRNHPRRYPTFAAYLQSILNSTTSIKFVVLILLSLQNSLFTVLRRYSQGIRQETYSKYEVLMMGEVIKLVFSAYMVHRAMTVDNKNNSNMHSDDPINAPSTTNQRLVYLTKHSGKMIGLAVIYG